jgi:hypothetical protein
MEDAIMVFYIIDYNYKYKEIELAEGTEWVGIKCPVYDGHQRAGDRIGDLKINLNTEKATDFMQTFFTEWILNDRAVEILRDNNITGFETRPVEVCNKELSYHFWELIVKGNGGEAHPDSGIYLKEECPYCNLKVYSAYENGIIINVDNWDKSDIFTITGYPGRVIVTEKVKILVEENRLTGMQFIPSHELVWSEYVVKP